MGDTGLKGRNIIVDSYGCWVGVFEKLLEFILIVFSLNSGYGFYMTIK
jgi:hypothetical protein